MGEVPTRCPHVVCEETPTSGGLCVCLPPLTVIMCDDVCGRALSELCVRVRGVRVHCVCPLSEACACVRVGAMAACALVT